MFCCAFTRSCLTTCKTIITLQSFSYRSLRYMPPPHNSSLSAAAHKRFHMLHACCDGRTDSKAKTTLVCNFGLQSTSWFIAYAPHMQKYAGRQTTVIQVDAASGQQPQAAVTSLDCRLHNEAIPRTNPSSPGHVTLGAPTQCLLCPS